MNNQDKIYVEDYSFSSLKSRPKLLNILLIISSIFLIATLTSVTQKLINGPLTQVQLEQEMIDLYGTPTILKSNGFDDNAIQSVQVIVENSKYINNNVFYLSNISLLVTVMIGFSGVFLMFFLKKAGFYIYIIYSILPIISMYLTTPQHLILNECVILLAVSSAILITLYGISMWLAKD